MFERRCCTLPAEQSAAAALAAIDGWLADSAGLLESVQDLCEELDGIEHLRPILNRLRDSSLDLGAFADQGPVLAGYCLIYPPDAEPAGESAPDSSGPRTPAEAHPGALERRIALDRGTAVLGLAPSRDVPALLARAAARGARVLQLPSWLDCRGEGCIGLLARHEQGLRRELAPAEARLLDLGKARQVDRATAVLERIGWFHAIASGIRCEGEVCWITGWTEDPSRERLDRSLREVGVDGRLEFLDPPEEANSPTVSRRSGWLRPFEVFTELIGVPGSREADPTVWVALLVPLMFGYMCGDLGHGALVVLGGLLLRRRTRLGSLLAVCGISAMVFGALYGDLFGYALPWGALWIRPLEEPMTILAVPIGFGALVLTLGELLHAVQTCWGGHGRSEVVADAAQLMVYWGILLGLLKPAFVWLSAGGALLCVGNRVLGERSLMGMPAGLGRLVHTTFVLLLNTLSFVRLGAFALSHAALEDAVASLAEGAPIVLWAVPITVLGNLAVVAIEVLVVSIQTTRLVLYEFFIRFFEGQGRPFNPVPAPPGTDRASGNGRRAP